MICYTSVTFHHNYFVISLILAVAALSLMVLIYTSCSPDQLYHQAYAAFVVSLSDLLASEQGELSVDFR
jgi:uncharacterized membrane protein